MFLFLKIFATIVGVYSGFVLAGIAIEWLKVFFDRLRPDR